MSEFQTSASTTGGARRPAGYLVSDLIGLALRQIGVGSVGTSPGASDIADGVMHLNMLLAKWQQERFIVPCLVDRALISTGASVYYLGPGGDYDLPNRPAQIEAAYARLAISPGFLPSSSGDFAPVDFLASDFDTPHDGLTGGSNQGPIDFPLTIISSYEDYAAISLKGLRSWPSALFYSPAFPLGELRFFPIPQATLWELHIVVKDQIAAPVSASDPINLPPEYWDLIMWTLAVRLAPSYGQEASATVSMMARSALQTIRAANQQVRRVQMPESMGPHMNGACNPAWIYGGGF